MRKPLHACVSGPLQSYAPGYQQDLNVQGYSHWTTKVHLELMGHLSRWLATRGLTGADLDTKRITEFLVDRRESGRVTRLTPRGLQPLLRYLRMLAVAPDPSAEIPEGWVEEVQRNFTDYLDGGRSLSPRTIECYRNLTRPFIVQCLAAREDADSLSALKINEFLLAQASTHSLGSLDNMLTAVRSFLQFLFLRGIIGTPLAGAVPHAANWRPVKPNRSIRPEQVRQLLESCDRSSPTGLRDFAILTLIFRLGLRSAEIATLSLDDINWGAGELMVVGKGNRHDRLPMPADVGEALADYCYRGRHRGACRAVFVHTRAPYAALAHGTPSSIVFKACERAGLPPVGAHQLRHSLATAMRGGGAPLAEIGQILRHDHEATTSRYTDESLKALAAIARPWPQASSQRELP